MEVRATTADDVAGTAALVERVWAARPDELDRYRALHGPPVDEPRQRRSIVADDGGVVVGVASGMTSARHPRRNQLAVHVHPEWRRRGIAGELVTHLGRAMEDAGSRRPWQVTLSTDDDAGRGFLLARGFLPLVRSRAGRLDVGSASPRPGPMPAGYRVRPAALDEEVVDVYERLYDECHWWAGGYVRYARGRPWISFVGDPLPGATFVAVDPFGEPVGALGLHARPEPGDAMLAVGGVLGGPRRPGAEAVTGHLLAAVLDAARRQGVRTVLWEADDPNVELWAVLRRLDVRVTGEVEAWAEV